MSFLSKFFIDGKEHTVLELSTSFNQPTDETGNPIGRPIGGQITLSIQTDGNADLFRWMKEHAETKDGKIVFYKDEILAQLLVLKFKKAYCIKYDIHFLSDTKHAMVTTLTLSAQEMDYGSEPYKNFWGTGA